MPRFSSTYISPTGLTNEIVFIAHDHFTIDSGGGMDWDKVKRIRESPGVVSPAYLFPGGHIVPTNRWLLPWFLYGHIGSQLVVFRPRNLRWIRPAAKGQAVINLEHEYEQARNSPWFTKKIRQNIEQYVNEHISQHAYFLLRGRIIQRVVAVLNYPLWADLIFDHFTLAPIQAGTTVGYEFIKAMMFIEAVMDACREHLVQAMRRNGHVFRFVQPLGCLTHTQHAGSTIYLHVANATHVEIGAHYVLLRAPGGPLLAVGLEDLKKDLWQMAPQSVSPVDNGNLRSESIQLKTVKAANPKCLSSLLVVN